MDQESLIAETNALIKQLIEREERQKAEAKESHAKFETEMAERKSRTDSFEVEGEEQLKIRLEEARAKSQQRIEESKAKEEQYKEQLLAELREQSNLLRQIAEKLGA